MDKLDQDFLKQTEEEVKAHQREVREAHQALKEKMAEYHPPAGTHIKKAARELCYEVSERRKPMFMIFNGVKLAALTNTTPDDILAAWEAVQKARRTTEDVKPEPEIPRQELKYRHSPEMGEISGFGGGYEEVCQIMLNAGMLWLEEHPDADPRFKGYEGVYGLLMEDNDDAKALTKVVDEASETVPGGGCTGAMHHAVMSRLLWIHGHSWEEYREEVARREAG